MAFFDSTKSTFTITDSTGAVVSTSVYMREINGLPGKRDLVDVTTFGSVGHRWWPSLENAEFTITALYSEDSGNMNNVFIGMRTAASTRAFTFKPGGATESLAGNCWMDDYSINSKVGDAVVATIHCKVDNNVTS
jgi:hypothetical protein